VLGALRTLGFDGWLSYKTDADTLAGTYGQGLAIYVSQPGSRNSGSRMKIQHCCCQGLSASSCSQRQIVDADAVELR
jgi:hypothetical protein